MRDFRQCKQALSDAIPKEKFVDFKSAFLVTSINLS